MTQTMLAECFHAADRTIAYQGNPIHIIVKP